MKMTFDNYIQNPMGIKNSVISNREMYRGMYIDKLNKILVREAGRVKYTLYKSDNKFFIHMKIPSEVVDKFYYDTVIEFYTDNRLLLSSRSLQDYSVKFYSNDPSFVFTFAHAFIKNDLFIKDIEDKMSKEAIKKAAKEKNPTNQVGYVKSLYFAYLLMKQYGLFNKSQFEAYGQKYDKKYLLSQIEHADIKIEKRRTSEEEQRKKKNIEKKKTTSNNTSQVRNSNISVPTSNISHKIGTVNTVKTTAKTTRTNSHITKTKKKR